MTSTRQLNRVQIHGPLHDHAEGFETELVRLGFTPLSRRGQFYLMAHFSRWLEAEGTSLGDLTMLQVDEFLAERKATYTALFTRKALHPLLGWLAESGAISAEVARGPLSPEDPAVLVRFERYLLMERRIGAPTTSACVVRVRRFLRAYCPPEGLAELDGAEYARALLDEGGGAAPASVKKFGYALRAFLRFCFITGELDHDLTGATLVIWNPLPSLLPMGASIAQINILLKSCDRRRAVGRRDYAVILLLSRLGLRAGEVAGMRLEDIHWRRGEVLIRGKGAKDECLPLPAEVGVAVVDYLQHARPPELALPEVFCTVKAPRRRLSSPAVWVLVTPLALARNWSRSGPTSCATAWLRRWSQPKSLWRRSVRCCAMMIPRPRRTMPGSTSSGCGFWPSPGPPGVRRDDPGHGRYQFSAPAPPAGARLRWADHLLHQFAAHLTAAGIEAITLTEAISWCILLPAGATVAPATRSSRRMEAVRGFAAYMHALDSVNAVPPRGIFGAVVHRPTPYFYGPAEITAVIHAATTLAGGTRAQTYPVLFDLLAATGLRVGEALALDRATAVLDAGVLLISRGKGGTRAWSRCIRPRLPPSNVMRTGALTCTTSAGQRSSPTQPADG